MTRLHSVLALVAALAVCLAAAGVGGFFTSRSVGDWYQQIRKPSFTPPSALFGPVWTALYLTMALAAWLVYLRRGSPGVPLALALFGLQLILNAGWSALFFGLRNPGAAFVEIVVLWLAILATIVACWRVTPWAGALLLPYLAWVTFASALNYAIWSLSR